MQDKRTIKFVTIIICLILSVIINSTIYAAHNQVAKLFDNVFNRTIGSDAERIKSNLGKPIKKKTTKYDNLSKWCYENKFYYDGAEVTFFTSKDYCGEIQLNKTYSIIITGNKYTLPNGIKIGVSKKIIYEALGKPQRIEGNLIRYFYDPESEIDSRHINFIFKNEKLEKIEFLKG